MLQLSDQCYSPVWGDRHRDRLPPPLREGKHSPKSSESCPSDVQLLRYFRLHLAQALLRTCGGSKLIRKYKSLVKNVS